MFIFILTFTELLYEKLISPNELKYCLDKSKENGVRLGETLIAEGIVSEEDVLKSLCMINKEIYLNISPKMISRKDIDFWKKDFLIENAMVPVLEAGNAVVFAISDPDDKERLVNIIKDRKIDIENIKFIYSTRRSILNSIENATEDEETLKQLKTIGRLIEGGKLTLEEGIVALKYLNSKTGVNDILYKMGFLINMPELSY